MRNVSLAVCLFMLTGCQQETEYLPGDVVGPASDPVTMVAGDDAEMAAAEKEARENLDQFLQALQNPTANQSDFSVKYAHTDGDEIEHMWIINVKYENGTFTGALGNEPVNVHNIAIGDTVEVERDQAEDWLYYDGEDLKGGYTVKVLMSRQ